ncbi:MAG: shikimate kinase [Roseburia sp.]
MMKDNIVLIGMPGVGKSTVGVVLAKALGYRFVDTDLLIQQAEGKLLWELIEEHGTDGFLAIENRVNASLEVTKSVIATGGSAVYGQQAMEHLGATGTIVYLRTSYDQLEKRLGNLKDRGVVLREGQSLKDLYQERSMLYERYADITIDEDGRQIRETVEMVKDALQADR